MAEQLPDIKGYLRTQGFGPRELATLEVADSWAIAGQIAFELNIPHSDKLEEAVVGIIATAKDERDLLFRTEGVLAGDLAWMPLASSSHAPLRPWLDDRVEDQSVDEKPPPGEKVRKLLPSGEERAARERSSSRSCGRVIWPMSWMR